MNEEQLLRQLHKDLMESFTGFIKKYPKTQLPIMLGAITWASAHMLMSCFCPDNGIDPNTKEEEAVLNQFTDSISEMYVRFQNQRSAN